MAEQYFVSSRTGALLRRRLDIDGDMAWTGDNEWVRTDAILNWTMGQDDDVDPVTEDAARLRYPAAFADDA